MTPCECLQCESFACSIRQRRHLGKLYFLQAQHQIICLRISKGWGHMVVSIKRKRPIDNCLQRTHASGWFWRWQLAMPLYYFVWWAGYGRSNITTVWFVLWRLWHLARVLLQRIYTSGWLWQIQHHNSLAWCSGTREANWGHCWTILVFKRWGILTEEYTYAG